MGIFLSQSVVRRAGVHVSKFGRLRLQYGSALQAFTRASLVLAEHGEFA